MFAIVDIEGIQVNETHICVREMYILADDGITDYHQEFVACSSFQQIEKKYQNAFIFCKRFIHKLNYYPKKKKSEPCTLAATRLKTFIKSNNIDVVFFKGGVIEKRLCDVAGIRCFDIGSIVPKVYSHNPRIEVHSHFHYLTLHCREEIKNIINRI